MRIEHTQLTYRLVGPAFEVPLKCLLLESGRFEIRRHNQFFKHPSPAFNRLFLFKTGGARVSYPSGTFSLTTHLFHVIPINHSFDVEYKANTTGCFVHFQLQTPIGLDVFGTLNTPTHIDGGQSFDRVIGNYGCESEQAALEWQFSLLRVISRLASFQTEIFLKDRINNSLKYRGLLEFICANCRADMTVNGLADRVHTSRSALSKAFRRATGIALKDHLARILLQRTKERLVHTEATVKEIASELGYTDVSYLFHSFKAHTGQTPSEYRRTARLPNGT